MKREQLEMYAEVIKACRDKPLIKSHIANALKTNYVVVERELRDMLRHGLIMTPQENVLSTPRYYPTEKGLRYLACFKKLKKMLST